MTILWRTNIVRAALKDTKGDYGRFLIKWYEESSKTPPVKISFKASGFMKDLAIDYRAKCM